MKLSYGALSCAWCDCDLDECTRLGRGIVTVGTRFRSCAIFHEPDPGLHSVEVRSIGRHISAMVTTLDSDARRNGSELVFATCGDSCAAKLSQALQDEKEFNDWLDGPSS